MPTPPVCLASDWRPDRGFFGALEHRLHARGLSTYLVWPENLDETLGAIRRGDLRFSYFVDRASNTSREFLELSADLTQAGVPFLDCPTATVWATDKATMHLEFLRAGIEVPNTVILDPLARTPALSGLEAAVSVLGIPFVVKPANTTGGGVGVFDRVTSWQDIEQLRSLYPHDKYLVQERMLSLEQDGLRFWFRVFHAFGETFSCWWDERSHIYAVVSGEERERHGLEGLESTLRRIAGICQLNLFSSEMVKTADGRIVVVDYVNETPDLRRQSGFPDGVPDGIVDAIADVVAARILGAVGS